MFAGRRQPGGTRTPSPGRGGCGAPGAPGPGPGCAAAPRGRFVRGKPAGVTSKRDTARPQTAPPAEKSDGNLPRPHRPPPPRPRRCLPPSFEAAQSFRVNEKSLRKGRGGAGSAPSSPSRPLRISSPRCCRFSPLPAWPTPDPPAPGHGGRRSRAGEGAGPGRTPVLLLTLNTSRPESAERMKIFTRVGHLKKLYYIPPKGKGREMKSGGVGKGPDLAAKTVLKLKRKTNKKHPVRAQISMNGRGGPGF